MRSPQLDDLVQELREVLPWVLLLFVAAAMVLLMPDDLHGQEPTPNGCYQLHEVLGPPSTGAESQTFPWVLCPFDSWRDLGGRSPLTVPLLELAETGPAEARWWARELAGASGYTLNRGLCRAVAYVRSVSPPDPDDGRARSGHEIQAWVLGTLTGPTRPPEIRALRPIVEAWSPEAFRAWHDALKAAWPAVAAQACPEME